MNATATTIPAARPLRSLPPAERDAEERRRIIQAAQDIANATGKPALVYKYSERQGGGYNAVALCNVQSRKFNVIFTAYPEA